MAIIGNVPADQLRSFIERIEKLSEERDGIAADIRDVFAEAKGHGFDGPSMREVIKLRKLEAAVRDEREHMLDIYLVALGMSSGSETPK
jgi:uncharacterized protein (UPF0335 family)